MRSKGGVLRGCVGIVKMGGWGTNPIVITIGHFGVFCGGMMGCMAI